MRTFHRVHEHRAKLPGRPAEAEKRLPLGQSIVVITSLSVLCWGVVVLLAMALRTVL